MSRASRWTRLRARLARRSVLAGSLAVVGVSLLGLVLLFREPPRPGPLRETPGAPATVTVDRVELKAEGSPRSRTVARLERGARVEVAATEGLWVAVRSGRDSGFLPVDAIERDSDRDIRGRRASTVLSFRPLEGVVVEDAELLLAPYPMAARSGNLEKGSVVRVYSVDGAYYALKGPDGGLAFVESSRVDLIPPDPTQPAILPAKDRAPKNVSLTDLAPLPGQPAAGDGAAMTIWQPESTPPPGQPAPPARMSLEAATLVTKVEPRYPESARRAGLEGTVVLDVAIDAEGRVAGVAAVRSPSPILSDAASAAVRLWRYRPARGPAGPIASRKEVRIDFRLR